jgi:hypothetical protein
MKTGNRNLEIIKSIQQKSGLTNAGFAKTIGISYVHWRKIRARMVPLTDTVLMKVMRCFPKYAEKILLANNK